MQILTRCGGGENPKVYLQSLFKLIPDILDYFLLRRSGKTGDRNLPAILLPLITVDKLPYIKIIDSEILPPGGEAMGFINHYPHQMSPKQYPLNCLRSQHFR